jgi:hypothetical protein
MALCRAKLGWPGMSCIHSPEGGDDVVLLSSIDGLFSIVERNLPINGQIVPRISRSTDVELHA